MIDGVRGTAVLAFADELADQPALLRAWSENFNAADDATLVIYAPDWSAEETGARLEPALAAAGIADDGGSADLLALPGALNGHAGELAERCGAVLTRRQPDAPFDTLRRVDDRGVAELRDLLPARRLEILHDHASRVSAELLAFSNECPNERRTILEFLIQASEELKPGTRVLDVGAGEQPYRELFEHVDYVTSDWANSVHPGARRVDIVAPADDLPIDDESFDAVINTQVLEHVAEPAKVAAELHRVLRPGGRLYMTLPLAWELHEEPFDFYRYTRYGISHLLRSAGFTDIDARPRNDIFTTLAQLLRNAVGAMGRAPDGLDAQRAQAGAALMQMSGVVQSFAQLDTRWSLPLGYAIRAKRPEA